MQLLQRIQITWVFLLLCDILLVESIVFIIGLRNERIFHFQITLHCNLEVLRKQIKVHYKKPQNKDKSLLITLLIESIFYLYMLSNFYVSIFLVYSNLTTSNDNFFFSSFFSMILEIFAKNRSFEVCSMRIFSSFFVFDVALFLKSTISPFSYTSAIFSMKT